MELTDAVVLVFILACFAVFMSTLAWASRPPRPASKGPARSVPASGAAIAGTNNFSVLR